MLNFALRCVRATQGFTLIELLITMVIGTIAMFALAPPFIAERRFLAIGRRQTEAQRDAQVALRAIARAARGSNTYAIAAGGAKITFTPFGGGASPCFQGGPSFSSQLQWFSNCGSGSPTLLIDGNRSKVSSLVMTPITVNKVVRVLLLVTYENQRTELLETDLFLRNAT